ncbi:MAG: acyl-CoA desaturase [Planctomycetota bacterium]
MDSQSRSRAPLAPGAEDRVEWARLWPFAALHLGCLLVLWVGVSPVAVWTCVGLYAARMFAITAFYHRYLSHRSFTAPRWVVFLGTLLAASSAQRGPLWWAAHHRRHHRHADAPGDAHSPLGRGFLWAHVGWFTTRRNFRTDLRLVPDLARLPELRWLDRFDLVAPLLLLATLIGVGEWLRIAAPGLGTDGLQLAVWGFCISTTALFHVTSMVNSVGHLHGSRPFATGDDSRNSAWLALLTFGEGWHNNHHWCPGAVRQGFRWWQLDLSFYLLWLLERLRLVRLRPLPARVRVRMRAADRQGRRARRRVA